MRKFYDLVLWTAELLIQTMVAAVAGFMLGAIIVVILELFGVLPKGLNF